jgi:hypothetical protein
MDCDIENNLCGRLGILITNTVNNYIPTCNITNTKIENNNYKDDLACNITPAQLRNSSGNTIGSTNITIPDPA